MGGIIAVTVRALDSTEYRMARWTNGLSDYITNINLCNKNQDHIDQYLNRWKEMETDWINNKDTGKFKFPMTSCYLPDSYLLAPIGYGLVVVDYVENFILHSQGYTRIGSINSSALCDPEDLERFDQFKVANRIKKINFWEEEGFTINDINQMTAVEIRSLDAYFEMDMSPFEVIRYGEHDRDELKRMQSKIVDLGFTLSEEELQMWEDFVEE